VARTGICPAVGPLAQARIHQCSPFVHQEACRASGVPLAAARDVADLKATSRGRSPLLEIYVAGHGYRDGGRSGHGMERIGASHRQHSTERPLNMKRAARLPTWPRTSQGARPCKPNKILPTIRRKDLPVVHLPWQTRSQGGKTKLTNHRAAIILHAISCGCYRETAAELASIKAETLSHWMGWNGEPYKTFQRRRIRPARGSRDQVHIAPWTQGAERSPSEAGGPRLKIR
jgi:hypothetical protein